MEALYKKSLKLVDDMELAVYCTTLYNRDGEEQGAYYYSTIKTVGKDNEQRLGGLHDISTDAYQDIIEWLAYALEHV